MEARGQAESSPQPGLQAPLSLPDRTRCLWSGSRLRGVTAALRSCASPGLGALQTLAWEELQHLEKAFTALSVSVVSLDSTSFLMGTAGQGTPALGNKGGEGWL